MPFRSPSKTSIAVCLAAVTCAAGALPEALRPAPVPVRIELPRRGGSCLKDSVVRMRATLEKALARRNALVPDGDASALMVLKIDSSSNLCNISLEYRGAGDAVTARRILPPPRPVGLEILDTLARILDDSLRHRRSGSLDIATVPEGARVVIADRVVDSTPFHLEDVRPGLYRFLVYKPGWKLVGDTVTVTAGGAARWEDSLERSAAWIDSTRVARVEARRDSIWQDAIANPAKDQNGLFARLAAPVKEAGRSSVAVLPFEPSGDRIRGYDPGVMAAEYGVLRFGGDRRFDVVPASALERMRAGKGSAHPARVPDSAAAAAGRLAGAKYVVTGTVIANEGRQKFAARMVSVESGAIVSAGVVEKMDYEVERLYGDSLGDKSKFGSAVWRSLCVPGWGQFHLGRYGHGVVASTSNLAAVGFATWAGMKYSDDGSDDNRNLFASSLIVLGAAWTLNVVDAALLGHEESERVRPRYFALTTGPRPDGLALALMF